MIDLMNPDDVRREAERRRRLREQGAETFDAPAAVDVPAIAPGVLEAQRRQANVLEKEEQYEVRKRFVVCGFECWNFSQPRATKQSRGIPDMLFMHRELNLATFWETKRQVGGRFSAEQIRFAEHCSRTALPYAAGDRYDAERWLTVSGVAVVIDNVFENRR